MNKPPTGVPFLEKLRSDFKKLDENDIRPNYVNMQIVKAFNIQNLLDEVDDLATHRPPIVAGDLLRTPFTDCWFEFVLPYDDTKGVSVGVMTKEIEQDTGRWLRMYIYGIDDIEPERFYVLELDKEGRVTKPVIKSNLPRVDGDELLENTTGVINAMVLFAIKMTNKKGVKIWEISPHSKSTSTVFYTIYAPKPFGIMSQEADKVWSPPKLVTDDMRAMRAAMVADGLDEKINDGSMTMAEADEEMKKRWKNFDAKDELEEQPHGLEDVGQPYGAGESPVIVRSLEALRAKAQEFLDYFKPLDLKDNLISLLELQLKIKGMRGEYYEKLSDGDKKKYVTSIWLTTRWANHKCPSFNLTHGLACSLAVTDYGPPREWHLPFDTIVIQLPKPSPVVLPNPLTGKMNSIDLLQIGTMPAAVMPPGMSKEVLEEEARNIYQTADSRIQICMRTVEYGDPSSLQLMRPMPDHMTSVSDWVDTYFAKMGPSTSQIDEDTERGVRMAWRIVFNLLEYIESKRDFGDSPAPALPEAVKVEKEGKHHPQYRLGREVKLPAPKSVLASIGTEGWKLQSRFMVRGHWKPNLGARLGRSIWIHPYWKGPKNAAEAASRMYVVEKVKDSKEEKDEERP